ncbi:GDYXXLXY domain-containing protein [Aquibacillus saliphilus]|uniref:GDYXXLXY domain-containing protein n=1 Tax=Aquibacillus saliphilus TaxID=1909422 RepID=UPI001CF03162|nr:GDYXXLXY domain-containing protein [Aquibacillus saliphilus]
MKRIFFYIIVGLQFLFLVGMAASYYMIDYFGETIKLETLPVDPQDIFYGDYVTLRYEIEEIQANKWGGNENPTSGNRVYVLLENKEGAYQVVKASDEKFQPSSGQVMLTAKYKYHDSINSIYQVDYGLGRYYIEDNTGQQYEQSGEMIVTVAVAPWGQKKITDLK